MNTRLVVRQGLKALNVPDTMIRRVLDTTRKWVALPDAYLPTDLDRFASLPGVHRSRELTRIISAPRGIVGLLGTVRDDTLPVGGIESELDALLRGVSGRDARVRDGLGNLIETPALNGLAARAGHTVSLTINQSLQEIAERELADGIERTGATGGDVVMMDPRDGSVLAMAGARNGKASITATALAEPYEPGSVMKPFIVSRALELKRVHPDEMINTEGGEWTVANRKFTDEHKAPFMSVRDVIRNSSNIGAAKIAMRLSQREEYEVLRDFGFGTPTGVPYPAESRGRLPSEWGPQTPTAMAVGYEISATPLQIAAAYVAIANDGELLQPGVVREVRDVDGHVVYTHQRRVIRRVIEPGTARLMRTMLASVVDSGTSVAADLATFDVGGKSGTARRAEGKSGYANGKYNSSFAGMFPVQAPQYRAGGAARGSDGKDLRRNRRRTRGERDPAGGARHARRVARPSRARCRGQAHSHRAAQEPSRRRRSPRRFATPPALTRCARLRARAAAFRPSCRNASSSACRWLRLAPRLDARMMHQRATNCASFRRCTGWTRDKRLARCTSRAFM